MPRTYINAGPPATDRRGLCPWEVTIHGTEFHVDPILGSDATGDGSPGNPWASIQFVVGSKIDGTGNTFRNNITTRNLSGGENNLEIQPGEETLYFADWLGLDLSSAAGSPAIDTSNPNGATTHDIEGTPRDPQPDVSAYEYVAP